MRREAGIRSEGSDCSHIILPAGGSNTSGSPERTQAAPPWARLLCFWNLESGIWNDTVGMRNDPTHHPLQQINDYRPEKKLNSQQIHRLAGVWVIGFSNDILGPVFKFSGGGNGELRVRVGSGPASTVSIFILDQFGPKQCKLSTPSAAAQNYTHLGVFSFHCPYKWNHNGSSFSSFRIDN